MSGECERYYKIGGLIMKKTLEILSIFTFVFLLSAETNGAWFNKKEAVEVKTQNNNGEVVPEEGAKLVVWDEEGPQLDYLMIIAEKFTEEYGVEFEFEPVSAMAAGRKIAQDGPAGTGADVFALNHDLTVDLFQSGIIMQNLVSAERIENEYLESAVKAVRMGDGKIYGFPYGIGTGALIYNKEISPTPPKTMKELIEIGREHTDPFENEYGFIFDMQNFYTIYGFIKAKGGYLFGDNETNPNKLGLNTDETKAGIAELMKMKEIGLEDPNDYNYNVMTGLFNEGKVAFIINGPWAMNTLRKASMDFGVAAIPTIDGEGVGGFSTIQTYVVNSYSKYPRAAQLFAKMATTDENLVKRYEMTGQIPPSKKAIESDLIKNDEYTMGFLEQIKYATPMPQVAELRFVWDPMGAALSDIASEKKSISEAIEHASEVIEDQIKAYRD